MKQLAPCLTLLCCISLGSAAQPAVAQPAPTPEEIETRPTYYDSDGLIVHHDANGAMNGGDTAQREGWYWLGVWLRKNRVQQPWVESRRLKSFADVRSLLEPGGDGIFYRHPKLPPWNEPRSKEWGLSRDQLIPLVAAMGVSGMKDEIRRLWNALPEDMLGKHALNGNYRNLLGQDGMDCQALKKRGCDATRDCSLAPDDTRDCSYDGIRRRGACPGERGCSSDCTTSNCTTTNCRFTDFFGATQCPCGGCGDTTVCVPGVDLACQARKTECETKKGLESAACEAARIGCEAEKASVNIFHKAQHDACEAAKSGTKIACEAQKAADQALCMATNVHSGDWLGPDVVNLFRRALDENPQFPSLSSISLSNPAANLAGGLLGDDHLLADVQFRLLAALDRNDTGDDLNLIVMLLMAQIRYPSLVSTRAQLMYTARPLSYGSYLRTYYGIYGNDGADMAGRIAKGIASGWQPDASGPYGAIKWYHRPTEGANPLLARLYEPVVDHWFGNLVRPLTSPVQSTGLEGAASHGHDAILFVGGAWRLTWKGGNGSVTVLGLSQDDSGNLKGSFVGEKPGKTLVGTISKAGIVVLDESHTGDTITCRFKGAVTPRGIEGRETCSYGWSADFALIR